MPEDVYKQVAPAGVAAELTAEDATASASVTALGRWLTEKLAAGPAQRAQIATLSGLSMTDLTALIDGHPKFRLDTDHVQRLATALVEAQVIPHADEVWRTIAASDGASEYIVPPAEVVRTLSSGS